MTDETTPHVLQGIQADLTELKQHALTQNRGIGNLANSILQLRTALDSHGTDIHTMALAIGEHGARLAGVEDRLW